METVTLNSMKGGNIVDNLLISIITPCFNSEKTIEKTIRSVLNQNYNNYEYIIIDGGSDDNTLNIINKYKPLFKNKLKVISEKDNGIYDAMNKGIRIANGELIGIINSDDFYEKNALELASKKFIENEYQIIYGMLRSITENDEEIRISINNHNFIKENMIHHPTCFITSNIYREISEYDNQYKYASDYDFMLKMQLDNIVKFIPIYNVISNFRIGGATSKIDSYIERVKIKKKYGLLNEGYYRWLILIAYIKKYYKKLINI